MTTRISTQPVRVPAVTASADGVRISRSDGSVTFVPHHDAELLASEIRGAIADSYLAGKADS